MHWHVILKCGDNNIYATKKKKPCEVLEATTLCEARQIINKLFLKKGLKINQSGLQCKRNIICSCSSECSL